MNLFGPTLGTFNGTRVIFSEHASEEVLATIWDEPRWSPHRSKRLWKKLRKKTARPHPRKPTCFQMGGVLYMHPEFKRELHALGVRL